MKQIIALGGGGFSMEPENLLLDKYILKQSKKEKPKVCFIPTASGDADSYISRFYSAFNKLPCEAEHLSLFKPATDDLHSFVMEQDILYVGGGNTKNLLVLWREWGLDEIIVDAWNSGKIIAGISAGSICWFEYGLTDSFGTGLKPLPCLGLLPGSNCPHYDGEEKRRPSYQHFIGSGELPGGYAADDGAALHFHSDKLRKVVSSRPDAKGYKVKLVNGEVVEEELLTEYLGDD